MFNISNLNAASAFVNAVNVAQKADYNIRKAQKGTEAEAPKSSIISEYTHQIMEFFQSLKTQHIKSA